MRFVYDNKIYDTEKSERVFRYITGNLEVILYKSLLHGDWFYLCTDRGNKSLRAIAAKYVRRILLNRERQDLVDKYFDNTYTE